jgi:predicted ferric reductase/Ca2+-binding EF-hand superfamily protein
MAAGKGARPAGVELGIPEEQARESNAPPLHSDIRALAPHGQDGPVDQLPPTDQELLGALETAVRDPSGADRRVDAAGIGRILGIRNADLARRIVAVLGGDAEGCIGADDFLAGVKRLLYGGAGDRRRFAFRIHDLDDDGQIDRAELGRMIALGCAEDDVAVRDGAPDHLAGVLLRYADRTRDGRISLQEFNEALDRHPQVAAAIEKSGARWLTVSEDVTDRIEAKVPHGSCLASRLESRLRRALENRRPYATFLILWATLNVAFFAHAWSAFASGGPFVQIARGCGACLNFNGALILLPMMRRVLTSVRKTRLRAIVPLDDAVEIHAIAGHTMFGLALVHAAAHLVNFSRKPGTTVIHQLLWPGPGLTGLVWLAIFAVMWTFARASARAKQKFEVFHTSHLLYVAWLIVGLRHGPAFYKWVAVPIGAFLVERVLRFVRRSEAADIERIRALRSGVTRLDLKKPRGFAHGAGDFIYLCIPRVARYEWHPFTISSAPECKDLSLHIRARGDWTAAVRRLAEARPQGCPDPIDAFIDGPYGAPSTDVFQSRRAVLIAGGIGVTPFASVLESIVMRSAANATVALDRVDFVWLNRDQYSFEWFVDLLASVERLDRRGLVRVHVFMTGGRSDAVSAAFDLARQAALAAGEADVVTGLRFETHMGAPRWPELLGAIALEAAGERVDVYFCGPPGLARKVAPICADAGMTFHEERF